MNLASIKHLKNNLQILGYHCTGGEEADPNLEVILGKNEDGGFWNLSLLFNEMPLEAKENGVKAYFMQLFLIFPYDCEKESIADVSRLLLMFNKSLPFPGFGLSEVDQKIYYRHSLYCDNGVVPGTLTCSLVGLLTLYLDSLSPMIKSIAVGKHQIYEVLEDALKLAKAA